MNLNIKNILKFPFIAAVMLLIFDSAVVFAQTAPAPASGEMNMNTY